MRQSVITFEKRGEKNILMKKIENNIGTQKCPVGYLDRAFWNKQEVLAAMKERYREEEWK